jgi:hypothetical protein
MATLAEIYKDPNFVNANAATKEAIFDKFAGQDEHYSAANAATQEAIRNKWLSVAPAPAETPTATAAPTATPVAKETSIKAPLVEAKASPSVMPFAVTNKEMAEKFGTSDHRSPVERLIAQQESKAPTPSPYKTEGAFERAGLTTDPHEALIRSIANEDQFTNPVAKKAARKVAETNVAIASDKAKQAMRSGASEEEANQIFKEHIGSIAGASVAPESYEYQKEYAFKPNATVAGDLGNLARRAGVKGITGLEQGAGGVYKFVADMVDANAPGIDAKLEELKSKEQGLSASELHGTLAKDVASIFENAGSSIIQQLPALGGGLALKSGQEAFVLGNMFVNSFGQTYDDSRRQGLDTLDSAIRSTLYGSFEVLGEKVGLGSQMKALKGIADSLPTSKVKEFFIDSLKKEIPGELGTYTGQFATDKGFGLNKDAGLSEYFDGAVQTVLATLAQGGMMAGAGTAASYVGNKFDATTQADNRAALAKEDALAKWKEEGFIRHPKTEQAPEQPATQQSTVPGQPAANQQPTQTHAQAIQQMELNTRVAELESMGVPPDDAKDIATKEQNEKLGGTLENDSKYTDNRPAVFGVPVSNVPGGNATGPSATTTTGLEGTTLSATNAGAGEGTKPSALTELQSSPLYPTVKSLVATYPNITPEQVATSFKITVPQATQLIEAVKLETTEEAAPQTKAAVQNVLGLQTTDQAIQTEQVAPTQTAAKEEPIQQDEHLQQAKQVANQLRKLDPTNPLLERLRSTDVMPDEIAQAQDIVNTLAPKKEEQQAPTADEVNQTLQSIYTPAQLKANPPVVVNNYDELPESIREEAKGSGLKAFVDPATGKDYYVADKMTRDNIRGAIFHERGVHIGLTNLIGAFRVNVLANQIKNWATAPADTLEHKIATEAIAAANASGEEQGSPRYNEEVIAYFTEIAVNKYNIDPLKYQPKEKRKVAEWLRNLWKNIAVAVRKINIDPSTLTSQDVVSLVQGASRVGTNRLEKAETKSVFTPEVLQDIQFAIGSSLVVAKEIGEAPVSLEDGSNKLQGSAKNLYNIVSQDNKYDNPITKTFINTFYENIKGVGIGINTKAFQTFTVVANVGDYFKPAKAIISQERLLRTLTPVANLQEALNISYRIRLIWNNPSYAARRESDLVSEKRERLASESAEFAHKYYFAETELGPHSETFKQLEILLKYALNKYTMAGDKLIIMSSDNEYMPVSFGSTRFGGSNLDDTEIEAVKLFCDEFKDSIFNGMSIKQAFNDAHNKILLAPRTSEIENKLGPTKTGWMSFSDQGEAPVVKLVTSDVGRTAKNPWCLAVQTSYGESYLRRFNFYVYLENANSLISVLVDKQTLQPITSEKAWFGLGESQNILPEHEYIKNTLPTLIAPINGAETTSDNTPNQDAVFTKTENLFKKALSGDKGTIKSLLSYDLYKSPEEIGALLQNQDNSVFKVTKEIFDGLKEHDLNIPAINILGMSKNIAKKFQEVKYNLEKIKNQVSYYDTYITALFPELNKLADENGDITINPKRILLYTIEETIPKDIFKDAEELLAKYGIKTNIYEHIAPYYQKGNEVPGTLSAIQEIKDYFFDVGHELYKIITDKKANNTATEHEINRDGHGLLRDAIEPIRKWVSDNTSLNRYDINTIATINIYDEASIGSLVKINNKFTMLETLKDILDDLYTDHNLGNSPLNTQFLDEYKQKKLPTILPKMVDAGTGAIAKAIADENKPKLLGSKAKLPSNIKNLWATAKAEMYHLIQNGNTNMGAVIAQTRQALGTKAKQLTQSHYELAFRAATAQLKKEAAIAKRKAPKPFVNPNKVKIGLAQNIDEIEPEITDVAEDLVLSPAPFASNKIKTLTLAALRTANNKTKRAVAWEVSTGFLIEKLINDYKIPYVGQLNKTINNMNVMYGTMMSAVSKLQDEWEAFGRTDPEANYLLNIVQLYSTLEDIDPTTFTTLQDALTSDPELVRLRSEQTNAPTMQKKHALTKPIQRRTKAVTEMFNAWAKLHTIGKGEGVTLFSKIKNYYKTMNMFHRKLLSELIERSDLEGEIDDATTPKGRLMAAINAQFVEHGIKNYFPLGRYGDYWVSFGKGKGKESYRFESELDREKFRIKRTAQLQAAGDTRTWEERVTAGEADIGEDLPALRKNLSADETDTLRKVLGIIDSQSKNTLTKDGLKDAVYQLFLETAPEQSFRKHWMHRKEIAGFTTDMKRHFINTGIALASQLSRLKYGVEINQLMENAEEYLKGNPLKEQVAPYINELKLRVNALTNPPPKNDYIGLVNGATQAVFAWTLSAPVTAIVDMTAMPIFGYSTLVRHFGTVDATLALTKQLQVWKYFTLMAKNSKGKRIPLGLGMAPHVKNNPILSAAYNEFVRTELLEKTSSHELLGMAKMPSNSTNIRAGMHATANILGFFFHQTGRLNREMMALTSFELAYNKAVKDGMTPGIGNEAYLHAIDTAFTLTNKAMFNYDAFNRPGLFRPLPLRVMFQLKSFIQYSVEFAAESINTAITNPEQRTGAIKQILVSTFMMLLAAGARGLLGWDDLWTIMQYIYECFHPMGKQQKFTKRDIKLWFEGEVLPNTVGKERAELILKGPLSHYTGIDFSSRISLASVVLPQRQAYANLMDSFTRNLNYLGPTATLISNKARAAREYAQGHYWEMWEHSLPSAFSNPVGAAQWAKEGVRNEYDRGIIVKKEDLTKWELMWKALGATPLKVAEAREENFKLNNAKLEMQQRKREILDRIVLELERKDTPALNRALREVPKYNRDNPYPEFQITPDTIRSSIDSRVTKQAKELHGLVLPDSLYAEVKKLDKAGKKEEKPK